MNQIERLSDIDKMTWLQPGQSMFTRMNAHEISVYWTYYADMNGDSDYTMTVREHPKGGCIINVSRKRKLQ